MENKNYNIALSYSSWCGYSVAVNGEVVLECLFQEDLEALRVSELIDLFNAGSADSEK